MRTAPAELAMISYGMLVRTLLRTLREMVAGHTPETRVE